MAPEIILPKIIQACLPFIAKIFSHQNEYRSRIAPFIITARYVHQELLYSCKPNIDLIERKLNELADSSDPIWIEDTAYAVREAFLSHARNALSVRKNNKDYRTEMERSETKIYLDNSKERLISVLRKTKVPPLFNPFEEN